MNGASPKESSQAHRPVTSDIIQAEWDATLHRLREVGEVREYNARVSPMQYTYVGIVDRADLDLEAIDRILFDNRLLAIWSRTCTTKGIQHYGGEWLWKWRKAVPFSVKRVGHLERLVPWQPQHQWTYRFDLEDEDTCT